MMVLVCGGRDFVNQRQVNDVLDRIRSELRAKNKDMTVVQGGASGADACAREWCRERQVPYFNMPADWRKHGRAAGPIRNQRMIDVHAPGLVVAFPGGAGTADMVRRAHVARIDVIDVTESCSTLASF